MKKKELNSAQKAWLEVYLFQNEMNFKEEEWNDVKAIHSSEIEMIYQSLKKLE